MFGWLDVSIEKVVNDLNDFDTLAFEGLGDISKRKEVTGQFWHKLHMKESLIRQKSREMSVLEEDRNTRYFHRCLKARRRSNQPVVFENNWV